MTVEVFDVAGRRVATLARGAFKAGRHTLSWDGATDGGSAGAGLYFVRARWEGFEAVRRIVRARSLRGAAGRASRASRGARRTFSLTRRARGSAMFAAARVQCGPDPPITAH